VTRLRQQVHGGVRHVGGEPALDFVRVDHHVLSADHGQQRNRETLQGSIGEGRNRLNSGPEVSGDEQREGADRVAWKVSAAWPEGESHRLPQSFLSERPQCERGEQDTEFATADSAGC
jgi:hypothetical protein